MPYGHRDEDWDAAKAALRRELVARAGAAETVTYEALAATLAGSVDLAPSDPVLGKLLGELSTEADAAGGGMLSAVVVRKRGGLPGPGFFALARRLGRDVGTDRRAFWESELARVVAAAT